VLGLSLNPDRPDSKLPYRGAWLWVGRPEEHSQMIHLMELPSPDPTEGRPAHGGRDRHFCVSVRSVDAVTEKLDAAGVPFTLSASGRKAVFYRDPDGNVLECAEMGK
jgi:glyoxylase I family protein